MIYLFSFLIIAYMALMSRLAGSGFQGKLPELLFAACIGMSVGYAAHTHVSWIVSIIIVLLVTAWSFAWKETGHKDALAMGRPSPTPMRDNTLTPVVNWLADRFGFVRADRNYSRLFFAVKGFLITLPIGGLGLIGYPLGYEIGERYRLFFGKIMGGDQDAMREVLAGAFVGVNVVLFLWVMS